MYYAPVEVVIYEDGDTLSEPVIQALRCTQCQQIMLLGMRSSVGAMLETVTRHWEWKHRSED